MMPDLPISLLPYVGNTGYTNNDLLVFVNYTLPSGTTSNTTILQHKEWILSGLTDYYVTAFTYNNANTFTLNDNSGQTFNATINTVTGLTVNGDLTATTISATTISGNTLYGDGSNITNIQNIYNTDGFLSSNRTLNLSGRTLTFKQGSTGVTETLLSFVDGANRDLFQIRSQYFLDTNTFDPYTGDSSSIYIGLNAGSSATGVSLNTVIGSNALRSLVSGGNGQVAIGSDALRVLTGGCCNVGVGDMAGGSLLSGSDNIFIGQRSARSFTGGTANVFIGANVVDRSTSGTSNVMIGKTAGDRVVGDNNVMIGREAGGGPTARNSSGNVFIGHNAGRGETGSNLLYIENSSSAAPLIYGDFANDFLRFNAKVAVNTLPSTFDFDVNGTSRFNGATTFGSTVNGFNLANSYFAFRGTGTSGFGIGFIPFNSIVTPNQNITAVSIMGGVFGTITYGVASGNNTFNNLGIEPTINTSGGTNLIRGVFFNPTLSGLTGTTIIGFQNTVGNNLFNSTSGNTGIGLSGTPTNKLHVSASTDPVRFEGLQLSTTDTRILTSDSNGVIEYRNFSDFTGGTGGSGVNTFVTAFTYNNANRLTISDNTGQTFNATINIVTGLTINGNLNVTGDTTLNNLSANTISATTYLNLPIFAGDYLPLSGGTVTGDTIFQSGLTANTISATTYLNVNAVTGGSYSNGTITLSGTGVVNGNTITGLTKYFITASTPTNTTINNGDRWYNTNNGIELVFIDDGNSSQWVQPSNTPGPPGYSNLMITSGITTSAATLDINTNYYGVNYNGQVNLTLPNPSGYDGYNITIKDEGGYAATHRIRLIPSFGLIDGNNYVDMNLNYIALHIVARNNNWWII